MVDSGIKSLSQLDDIGEAWKALFPNITDSSVIAIKANCVVSTMPTHTDVTYSVIEGLKQMSFNGGLFPENNIIIFDRWNSDLQYSGYTINTSGTGVRCFGTNSSGVGYSTESHDVNGSNQRISSIVTDMADYLINISVLKNHEGVAGVTLCLKNHYGTCNRPQYLHASYGDPYIPALNALTTINDKQCVNIIDALFGIYSGGPVGYPQFTSNKLIMSQDIVATDYWGRELLRDNGCNTLAMATHIDTAAQSPYNLGTNDPSQMDVIDINNPTTGIITEETQKLPKAYKLNQNYPNPFNPQTTVTYVIPESAGEGLRVSLNVYSSRGNLIKRLSDEQKGPGTYRVTWGGFWNLPPAHGN